MFEPTPVHLSRDLKDELEVLKLPSDNTTLSYNELFPNFEAAFFRYLDLDEKAFLNEYASVPEPKAYAPDFFNVSFEELFNIPVDEAREAALTVVQSGHEGGVNSEPRMIDYMAELWEKGPSSNPFATKSTQGEAVVSVSNVESEPQTISESSETAAAPQSTVYLPPNIPPPAPPVEPSFTVPNHYYIFNIVDPGIPAGPFAAPATSIIGAAPSIEVGNPNSLVEGVTPSGNDPMLTGAAPTSAGPFSLADFASSHGQVTGLNASGGFSYQASPDVGPVADNFSFQVENSLGQNGIATAFISIVVNQNFPGVFSSMAGFNYMKSGGNLIAGDAAASGATLDVLYMQDINGVYTPVGNNTVVTIDGEPTPSTTTITVSSNGDFIYESKASVSNPTFPVSDTFLFVVGDGHGNSASASATILAPPIVLDLTGEGIHLTSASDSPMTLGKLLGTENPTQIGWIEEGNGILMFDYNHNGQVTNMDQISFVSYLPGAKTDLEGLAAFDTNHDQVFDTKDADFNEFGVLLPDLQFKTLAQLGITSLSLQSDHQEEVMNQNIIHGFTTFQTTDGQSHAAADVSLVIAANQKQIMNLNEVIKPEHSLDFSNVIQSTLPHEESSVVKAMTVPDAPSVMMPAVMHSEQLIPTPEVHHGV